MRILSSWIFNFTQFKDIEVIVDVVTGKKVNEVTGEVTRDAYITTNNYPIWLMVTIHKVIENGNEEYYIHRPYYSYNRGGSGRKYHDILLKVPTERKAELEEYLG